MMVMSAEYCTYCDCHGINEHGYYCLHFGKGMVNVCPFNSCEKWQNSMRCTRIVMV